ncbi:hypothetical protein BC829DRAFT_486913 [Chytridium lagenaria]|nr:hypothetical protein BC829DRAFT_486913 [Chytridium lagenaria]
MLFPSFPNLPRHPSIFTQNLYTASSTSTASESGNPDPSSSLFRNSYSSWVDVRKQMWSQTKLEAALERLGETVLRDSRHRFAKIGAVDGSEGVNKLFLGFDSDSTESVKTSDKMLRPLSSHRGATRDLAYGPAVHRLQSGEFFFLGVWMMENECRSMFPTRGLPFLKSGRNSTLQELYLLASKSHQAEARKSKFLTRS